MTLVSEPERIGGSLVRRLFFLTSAFAIVCVALIALVLGSVYRNNAERRFGELVAANLYNLLGSIEPDVNGKLAGRPDLGDARFLNFGSGWYWSVRALADPANRIASPSLADGEIPDPEDVPFDENFQRLYSYKTPSGQQLTAIEAQVFLGTGSNIYSFKVTGDRGELSTEIASFTRQLTVLLTLFALGFVAASYGIVTIGLRPISIATIRLADIREGRASKLDGRFPREIQPLIDETNALIDSNRAVIERARTQVGNLAHSLKTPLAVLRNEAGTSDGELNSLILEQTAMMQHQVDNYLKRAQIAARHGTVTSATNISPVINRLARVIEKLNPEIEIEVDKHSDWERIFAGEQYDFEEILGNILDNAARYAKSHIRISVADAELEGRRAMRLTVADDGPGMNRQETELATKRGMRLDESAPGSGLGLAIVKDSVGEYRGEFLLQRSHLGGLAAIITLPSR